MKNYYEILEVDVNASSEVIEKAYKTLIKKYHPDLQPEDKKQEAEIKVKLINEAYDTLSDKDKKENYDNKLKSIKEQERMQREEEIKRKINTQTSSYNRINNSIDNVPKRQIKNLHQEKIDRKIKEDLYNQKINKAYNKAYNDAYIQALKNMGYEIEYEKSWKSYFKGLLVIIFAILFCIGLWHIPFIKNFILDFCNNNEIIRTLIDSVKSSFH